MHMRCQSKEYYLMKNFLSLRAILTSRWFASAIVISLAMPMVAFSQGALAPSGPPGPTFKTLSQVEPRIPISSLPYDISAPGSYYVTSNLTGVSSAYGIRINSSDVTLDLSGFTLTGVPGAFYGIATPSGLTNIVIRNGTVRGWGFVGVDTTANYNAVVENVVSTHNAGGFTLGADSSIRNCKAMYNVNVGISVDDRGSVKDCVSERNGLTGIRAGMFSSATGCLVVSNSSGGIIVLDSSSVTDCEVYATSGSDAIQISYQCRAERNHCARNTGAGIHATLTYNRIDSNHLIGNNRGIKVDFCNNVIVRNSAGANTVDYDLTVGCNTFGPIVYNANVATNSNPHANYVP